MRTQFKYQDPHFKNARPGGVHSKLSAEEVETRSSLGLAGSQSSLISELWSSRPVRDPVSKTKVVLLLRTEPKVDL